MLLAILYTAGLILLPKTRSPNFSSQHTYDIFIPRENDLIKIILKK